MGLVDLPHDLHIITFLLLHSVRDILALKQTCRVLHTCGSSDYLWHRVYQRLRASVDVEPSAQIYELSGAELQQLVVRALRLEHNWSRPNPQIRSYKSLTCSSAAAVDDLFLLNQSRWLVVAQRTRRNASPFASISLWSLVGSPYCAASLELPGRYRKIAAILDEDKDIAMLAVTMDTDQNVLQIHEVHLLQQRETSSFSNAHLDARHHNFRRPTEARGIVQDLVAEGDLVAAVFFDFDFEFPGDAYQIFLVNTRTWATTLLHPTFDQPINRLNLKLTPGRLILVGTTTDMVILRNVALPASVLGTKDQLKFLYRPTAEAGEQGVKDLGFLNSLSISSCSSPIDSDTLVLHSTAAPDILSLLFFDLQGSQPDHGHLVRLATRQRVPEAEDTPEVSGSGERQDYSFPMAPESTVKLVRIGATGRRAVWLEHNWEIEETRVMRAHFPQEDTGASSVSVLVPAVPELPFTPRAAQSLAFDETTGRLCFGLYTGAVWILDYNEIIGH